MGDGICAAFFERLEKMARKGFWIGYKPEYYRLPAPHQCDHEHRGAEGTAAGRRSFALGRDFVTDDIYRRELSHQSRRRVYQPTGTQRPWSLRLGSSLKLFFFTCAIAGRRVLAAEMW